MTKIRYFELQPATEPKPTGILRLTITDTQLTLEHYDPKSATWIDDPKALDFLNGDDADAEEIPSGEALKLILQLTV
jgi:hypothetical protein